MKKIIFMAALVSMLASCLDGFKSNNGGDRERDSLRNIIDQKDNELNDLIHVNDLIKNTMDRDFVEKIKDISSLTQQLTEKNAELEKLRAQLAEKDVKIEQLSGTVTNLQTENAQVKQQRDETAQIARNQDAQLNTAWYVFGTSKELKAEGILSKGEVLQGNYNKNYFTQIDIRKVNVIPLESKSASILTNHPAGSYTLLKDSKGKYTLRITDVAQFWSVSKYLVVKVK